MRLRGKRYLAGLKTFSREKRYGLDEAIQVLSGFPKAKFDETVELSVRLGTDPGKTDQAVRGSVSLPKGIGKTKKVIVFAFVKPRSATMRPLPALICFFAMVCCGCDLRKG